MANDQIGKIVRVTIAATFSDNQVQMNNLSYACTTAGGGDSRGALGAAVQTLFNAAMLPVMSSNSAIYGWLVQTLMPRPPDISVSGVNTIAGAGGATYVPSQARPLIGFKTALAGKKYRGRIYCFSPASTLVDAGGYPPAALNAVINAFGTSLLAPIIVGGSTWSLAIAHRSPGSPLTYTYDLVTARAVRNQWGTQRRSGNTGRLNVNPW